MFVKLLHSQKLLSRNRKKYTLLLVENIDGRKTRYAQTVAPYRCFHLSSLFLPIVALKVNFWLIIYRFYKFKTRVTTLRTVTLV